MATAQQDEHGILLPTGFDVRRLCHQVAMLSNAIPRHRGPDVGGRPVRGHLGICGIAHRQNRTSLGVAQTEQQQRKGLVLRHNLQVGLLVVIGSTRWWDFFIATLRRLRPWPATGLACRSLSAIGVDGRDLIASTADRHKKTARRRLF